MDTNNKQLERFKNLRSLFSSLGLQATDNQADIENWSQFVTSSSRHRGKTYRPWAFTELRG